MKKNNAGGYALPFVLVVMVILSLVAVTVMDTSLRGLKTQQSTLIRMQDQYKAEGEIEKVVSQLLKFESTETAPKEAFAGQINAISSGSGFILDSDEYTEISSGVDSEGTPFSYTFKFTSTSGTVKITGELVLSGKLLTDPEGSTKDYTVTSPQITYNSYEIGGDA